MPNARATAAGKCGGGRRALPADQRKDSPNVLAITCFLSAGILPVILDPPEDAGGTPALCEGDHGGLVPPPCGVHLLVVSGMLLRAITVVCSRVTHYTEPYVLKIGSGVCALPQGRELV